MRESISLQVPPHDVMILKVRAEKRYLLNYKRLNYKRKEQAKRKTIIKTKGDTYVIGVKKWGVFCPNCHAQHEQDWSSFDFFS